MRRLTLPVFLVWIAACDQPPPSGTSVGNPGKQAVRIADPADSVAVDLAVADALAIDWVPCSDSAITVLDALEVDLLGDTETEVPGGRGCGLVMTFDAPIRLTGVGTGGEMPEFAGTLDPGIVTLWAEDVIEVDEHEFVLEIAGPGWLESEELGLAAEPVEFGPEGDLGVLLAERVATDSALYLDDGDGVISADERAAGPVASPLFDPPAALGDTGTADQARLSTEGCNCATPGTPPWGLVPALLASIALRRPTKRPDSDASRPAGPG